MFEQPDNGNLAAYILHGIVSKMRVSADELKAGIEFEKNILRIEETATIEAHQHMKSLVGAFDHAAIVGVCLTSGWLTHHVDMLLDEENPDRAEADLGQFSHLILHVLHKKVPPIRPDDKRTKMQLVKMGFQLGLDLGRCLYNMTPAAPMSGIKMRDMLEMVKIEPDLILRGKQPLTSGCAHTR